MDKIELTFIGIICSPYRGKKDMPIQGRFRDDVKSGWLDKHFADGKIPEETIID